MNEQEYRDYLTGLYNRKWLFEECPLKRNREPFSLIYIDLDNFKTVNDLYGHEEGDLVLKQVADALSQSASDVFAVRMSGDEFVLVLSGEQDRKTLTAIYETVLSKIEEKRCEVPGLSVVSVSAGAVNSTEAEGDLLTALNLGDDAMYAAKRSGKHRCVFYEDIREEMLRVKRIQDEAPEAVAQDRFELLCNPLLNLQNGTLMQTRIVALWHREDKTVLYPSQYRPTLESNGFIRVLDQFLLEKLLREMSCFSDRRLLKRKLRFSLEISAILLLDRGLPEKLKALLAENGVKPSELDFSVTERCLLSRDAASLIEGMREIAKTGVSLSLKNYGANFAAIRYLNLLPVETFRFDQRWLRQSLKNHQDRKIVKSVIRMTKDAKKTVAAVGEFDGDERKFLASCGCDASGDYGEDGLFDGTAYKKYIKETLPKDGGVVYDFLHTLEDRDRHYPGVIRGEGIAFVSGISDLHGAVHFPGGNIGENVIELPPRLFAQNSYSIAFWIRPEKMTNWSSAVYMRFEGGFSSFVPYTNADDGISVYRISVDDEGFFDTTSRATRLGEWSFLCFAYDATGEALRYYINGRRAHFETDMPLQLGCRQVLLGGDPFQRSFEGAISSLCIYEYALSDGEVGKMYQSYLKEPGFAGSTEDYWMDS